MADTILIVGVGLIGGSLGLAIQREHPDAVLIGYDKNENEAKLAKALGSITDYTTCLPEAAARADLILLCTPVSVTERLIEEMIHWPLKENVIVSDVGSTKSKIMKKAALLHSHGITFIGGHPMAGSHKSGASAAKAILFENAFYLLTPMSNRHSRELAKLQQWLKGTKAKFLELDPVEHDAITGMVSHFPHIIASSLVHQVKQFHTTQPLVSRLAAGGFRDISRIASSDPVMWRDITMHNVDQLKTLLTGWRDEMDRVVELLDQQDSEAILSYFDEAKQFRDQMPILQRGAIPSFYDLFVDIPDVPGIISEVTGLLAKEEISIVNIRVMESREDIYGVLAISFQTEQDRERGRDCIAMATPYEAFTV